MSEKDWIAVVIIIIRLMPPKSRFVMAIFLMAYLVCKIALTIVLQMPVQTFI